MKKKGKCINFGNCQNADNKLVIEIDVAAADFICPEEDCGQELILINKKRFSWRKVLMVILLVFIGICYFSFNFIKNYRTKKAEVERKAHVQDSIDLEEEAKRLQLVFIQDSTRRADSIRIEDERRKKEIADSLKSVEAKSKKKISNPIVSDKLTANSLEEYFQKIADQSIPYSKKETLKKEIISRYFSGGDARIIERGQGKTMVLHTNISSYVETLSHQNYKIKITDKKYDSNNRITTIYIEEL